MLGEMIFGSVAMTYKGQTVKVHEIRCIFLRRWVWGLSSFSENVEENIQVIIILLNLYLHWLKIETNYLFFIISSSTDRIFRFYVVLLVFYVFHISELNIKTMEFMFAGVNCFWA